MDTNKLYKSFWYALFLFLTISVASMSACNITNVSKINDTVAKMIEDGTSPKEASCAVALANGNATESVKIYCAVK